MTVSSVRFLLGEIAAVFGPKDKETRQAAG